MYAKQNGKKDVIIIFLLFLFIFLCVTLSGYVYISVWFGLPWFSGLFVLTRRIRFSCKDLLGIRPARIERSPSLRACHLQIKNTLKE